MDYEVWLSTLSKLELIALCTGLVFMFCIYVVGLLYFTIVTLRPDTPVPGYDYDDDWGTGRYSKNPPAVPPEYVDKG